MTGGYCSDSCKNKTGGERRRIGYRGRMLNVHVFVEMKMDAGESEEGGKCVAL